MPVGWHASESVIADDKGLHDLLQSLHGCLYLPGLVTAVGVDEGHRQDFQQQAIVGVTVTALGRASVLDKTGGAVTALLPSSR